MKRNMRMNFMPLTFDLSKREGKPHKKGTKTTASSQQSSFIIAADVLKLDEKCEHTFPFQPT
jgi:hypothetical protein